MICAFHLIFATKLNKIFLAGPSRDTRLVYKCEVEIKRIGQGAIVVSHLPIYPVQYPNCGHYRRHSSLPVSRCQLRARNRESRVRKSEWGSQISHVRSWRPPTGLVGELFHRYWRFLTVLFSLPILSSWWLKSPFDHFLMTNLSCQYEKST